MFRANLDDAAAPGVLVCDLNRVLGAGGPSLQGIRARKPRPDVVLDDFLYHIVGQAGFRENFVRNALICPYQSEQQMFRSDISVTKLRRRALR